MKKILILICLIATCSACSDYRDYTKGRTEIEAFYYHEQGRYTAAILSDSVLTMVRVRAAIITMDARGKPWYECDYMHDINISQHKGACYVHLRSINDINTAGWDHGKFGSGTTSRLN